MLYISEDFDCTIAEGSLSISIWIMISVVGNAMLFGIVQNSRLQGDPLKQRITDQVSKWHYLIIRNGILRGLFIVDHLSWSPDYISEFYSSYYSAVGIYQAIRLEFQNKHFWRCCETFLYWLSSHVFAHFLQNILDCRVSAVKTSSTWLSPLFLLLFSFTSPTLDVRPSVAQMTQKSGKIASHIK